jgi:ketosteroid isomerase-like protein
MKDAKDLFFEFLSSFRDTKKATSLFADDGVVELPYLASLGIEPRYEGHVAIQGFFEVVLGLFPDFEFPRSNIRMLIETPTQAFAEYEIDVTAAATGRPMHQHFFGRLVAENGKIKLLREALNILATAQAALPGGAAELAIPGTVEPLQPGKQWLDIVQKASFPQEFAKSFADDVVLDTSIAHHPMRGVDEVTSFFIATRAMYETFGVTDEGWSANKMWLEWEGTAFGGQAVGGTTIVTRNNAGLIDTIRLLHRPLSMVQLFSKELDENLEGKVRPEVFQDDTPYRRPGV